MPSFNFDQLVDRQGTDSGKWKRYGDDVLPLWVADMDFKSPPAVIEALHERIDHGVFGYGCDPVELRALICKRMYDRYGWTIEEDDIVFLPGLVSGFNIGARAIGERGDEVMISTPVYFPFLTAPANQYRKLRNAPLAATRTVVNGLETIRYELDWDAVDRAISARTRLHILCNPHNPVGRAFTRDELEMLAAKCLEEDLVICSDEIHCDLLLDGTQHVPIASIDPEIAKQTITLMAPSKTFNLPGLACSFAIITNPVLRAQYERAKAGIVPHVNVLGIVAATAAYGQCAEWERELCDYLTGNRNFLLDYVRDNLPEIATTIPEATYLAWLDCNKLDLPGGPQEFFLNEAKIACNDGETFGKGGEGFVRFNFGCPRSTVRAGLDRMAEAIERHKIRQE